MPLRSSELIAEEGRLAREVVDHKAAIKRHRTALQRAARDLEDIRRRCAELGIGVIEIAPQSGRAEQ